MVVAKVYFCCSIVISKFCRWQDLHVLILFSFVGITNISFMISLIVEDCNMLSNGFESVKLFFMVMKSNGVADHLTKYSFIIVHSTFLAGMILHQL